MKFNVLNRKIHYWTTVFLALPLLVMICSGVLLQLKKQMPWVQPPEQRGSGTTPQVDLEGILASVMAAPGLNVKSWEDINRLDVRPGKGMVKVWLYSGWEAQVDLGTGDVMQVAYRRSDLIESIHDGSFFGGDIVKLGLFLPAGIALFLMWLTGLWMFILPYLPGRRRKRAAGKRAVNALRPTGHTAEAQRGADRA